MKKPEDLNYQESRIIFGFMLKCGRRNLNNQGHPHDTLKLSTNFDISNIAKLGPVDPP
jgi:hypothetical protein